MRAWFLVALMATAAAGQELPSGVELDALSYLLPSQHQEDDKQHFRLTGWTVQLDESCGAWCSRLELGIPEPSSEIKVLEIPARLPCQRELVIIKGRSGRSWERHCLRGDNLFLVAERGISLLSASTYRRFGWNVRSDSRYLNLGMVWLRQDRHGQAWRNASPIRYFDSCQEGTEPWLEQWEGTEAVFFGPYNLNDPERRADLVEVLGHGSEMALEDLGSLAEQVGLPGRPVRILVRKESWGADGDVEFYLTAKVGSLGIGRVGWLKTQNGIIQRLSVFARMVFEPEVGDRMRLLPHCGLSP